MRALNTRERMLAWIVMLAGVLSGGLWIRKQMELDIDRLKIELSGIQEKIRQEKMQSTNQSPGRSSPGRSSHVHAPWNLLESIKEFPQYERIKIVKIDRTSEVTYQLRVKALFLELMPFIGALENPARDFRISRVEIRRDEGNETIARPLEAVVEIERKGNE